jgi:hypothetical protein
MNLPTILSEPAPEYSPEYPAPPRVKWILLIPALIVFVIFEFWLVPKPARGLIATIVFYAWIAYLCLWIRKINPNSNSIFWAAFCFLMDIPSPYKIGIFFSILVAFVVRDELLEHYNHSEPINLRLDPVLTFFFSFLYFQLQLNEIAQAKRPQEIGPVQEPVRTLLS